MVESNARRLDQIQKGFNGWPAALEGQGSFIIKFGSTHISSLGPDQLGKRQPQVPFTLKE